MSDTEYEPNLGQPEKAKAVTDEHAETETPDADAVIGGLQDEIQRLNDKTLRLAAELENTRRRAEREKIDAGKYAIANFARDLLSVADTFGRALAATPAVAEEAVQIFVEGVRMTEKDLLAAFERHGVKRIEPKGEKFDPNLHMAVAQAPGSAPAGFVLDCAQPGYMIGDRVLRAAMVVVSTGAPRPAEPAPEAHDDPLAEEPEHRLDRRA
jgi:molecular chaperone GrpE